MGNISYEDKAWIEDREIVEIWFWIPNNRCKISGIGLEALLS